MPKGLDYSFARPSPDSVKSGGYDFICRYLSAVPGKNISADEANHAFSAGLSIALVWESTANRSLDGFTAGSEDAQNALQLAQVSNCGNIPAIYFAVDFDASEADQVKIDDYLKGAASVLGLPRVGVYGSYWVVKRCFDNGTVSWGWQTYAWSGKNWDNRAHLRQIQNGVKFNGMDVDIDEALDANYGQISSVNNDQDMQNMQVVIDNKQNEFRRDGEDTVRQIFEIPSQAFFNDVLHDEPGNIRIVPSDWPLDPAQWANEREKLRPELDSTKSQLAQAVVTMKDATNHIIAANARITELESQINIQPAPTPAPVPVPVPFPNLEELLKAIWNLITKK